MARPRRTIPCIHPRRTGSLSVSISEISQTPPSSPEPSHYGIQRAAAKSSQTENWPRQPQRNQSEFPRLKLERGAPQRDPPWRPGASRKAFQPTSTTLITNTMPCQIMVRCPLSRKWWSRILSRTSQASKRTPASACSHRGHRDWFSPLRNDNASNFASRSSSLCLDSKPLYSWHGFPSRSF